MTSDTAERVQVMTSVLLDIWQQAQRWREESDDDGNIAGYTCGVHAAAVFTAFGPLAAFEAAHDGPPVEWMPDSRAGSGVL